MSEKQKQETYESIWRILGNNKRHEIAYNPFSYNTFLERFEMKKALLKEFPEAVQLRLKEYLTDVA